MFKKFNQTSEKWDQLLYSLGEFNFYSLYNWGELRKKNNWNILRLSYFKNSKVTFACQVLHKKFFFINLCWIPGGPVGCREDFIKHIYKELSFNYGKLLVIKFNSSLQLKEYDHLLLKKNSWKKDQDKNIVNSRMQLNLPKSIDLMKYKLSKNWRHNLKRSTKYSLVNKKFNINKLNDYFKVIKSMEKYKNIKDIYQLEDLKNIFNNLSDNLFTVTCTNSNNEILSFRTIYFSKNRAWDLIAATSESGRKNYSSYFCIWKVIEFCYDKNIKTYDLTGVDKLKNIGVYNFKKGIGSEYINCLGRWQISKNFLIRFILFFYYLLKNNFKK